MTEQLSSSYALHQFINGCRTPATRITYTKALRLFMSYAHIDDYDTLAAREPKHLQMDFCEFVVHLRKLGKSYSSILSYVTGIKKFCIMNDIITINWKKVHSFMGEHEKSTEDRPYTHSEIKLLCEHASIRNRAIILLMASTGLRVGAIPGVRIKDLEPIDKCSIYKVTAYPHSRRYRYFSFCTPEARQAIDNYLEWRKRFGERITEDSPLFIAEYGTAREIPNPNRSVTAGAINMIMKRLLYDTGLRTQPLEGKFHRHIVMQNHGFRKFWETNAYKAGMDNMYIRRLMGQKSGLEDSYLKLSEEELLEGDSKHVGYIGVVDQLTIAEENRLKKKVHTLERERGQFDQLRREIDELRKFMKP
jgi:integrase